MQVRIAKDVHGVPVAGCVRVGACFSVCFVFRASERVAAVAVFVAPACVRVSVRTRDPPFSLGPLAFAVSPRTHSVECSSLCCYVAIDQLLRLVADGQL